MIGPGRAVAGRSFSLSRLHKAHPGSAGYIVSTQAARDLIRETAGMSAAIDDLVFNPAFRIASGKTIYQLDPALCAQDHILDDRSVGLPSTLERDRATQLMPPGKDPKGKKRTGERLGAEFRRLGRQIKDIYLRKKKKIIPFDHCGELVLPPHTQRRENAL
jgi:glycosyl transferase family 25